MAKRARVDEATQDENKQSSKPANALTKYQKEMEVFIRTKLGQNVVFGMKNCDKHLRVSYHSEDVNQKENRKIIDLFRDLLPFPVIVYGWKGVINVCFYRPEDIFIATEWEFESAWSGGEPTNKKWFYRYDTNGEGTVQFLIDLIRFSQELFYLSRFGGKFSQLASKAYQCLIDKEKEKN